MRRNNEEEWGLPYLHAVACANVDAFARFLLKIESLLPSARGRMYGLMHGRVGSENHWRMERERWTRFS